MLCSGKTKREGWLTLDANAKCKPDYHHSLPGFPFSIEEQSWDEIELIHGIEHFYLWEARQLLKECYALLRPGGRLVLEQPNILYAAKVMAGLLVPPKGAHGQFDMWPLYGDPNHKSSLFCHRWGYTPVTLAAELTTAGFDVDNITHLPARSHYKVRDFRMEAIK
jgi:SAM-dependent methyltransferase